MTKGPRILHVLLVAIAVLIGCEDHSQEGASRSPEIDEELSAERAFVPESEGEASTPESQADRQGSLGTQGVLRDEIRIDGTAENLVAIGAVAVRQDGAIALAQDQDGQIRFYRSSGELQGTFGRRGEGPGEFSAPPLLPGQSPGESLNPLRIGWLSDTLWVYDGLARRITIISPDLELASTFANVPGTARPAPEDAGRIPDFPRVYHYSLDRDGFLYSSFGIAENQAVPEPFVHGRTPVGRMTLDGVVESVIVHLPSAEYWTVRIPGGGTASMPFPNFSRWAVSPDLGRVVVAMASLEGEDAGSYSLAAIALDGDTLFARRFPFHVEPIPPSVADSAMQATISRAQQLFPDLAEALRREGRVPPLYPPLENLVLGRDGTVWIELRARPQGIPFHVVDPSGAPVGSLALKPKSRIAAATRDRIWVVERDEFDVQSVVRYAVSWEPPVETAER